MTAKRRLRRTATVLKNWGHTPFKKICSVSCRCFNALLSIGDSVCKDKKNRCSTPRSGNSPQPIETKVCSFVTPSFALHKRSGVSAVGWSWALNVIFCSFSGQGNGQHRALGTHVKIMPINAMRREHFGVSRRFMSLPLGSWSLQNFAASTLAWISRH